MVRACLLLSLVLACLAAPATGWDIRSGGSVVINEPVADDLLVTGERVVVESEVQGDLIAAGTSVTVGPTALIRGNAMLAGETVELGGQVGGSAYAAGQRVNVPGHITRNAGLAGQTVSLSDRGSVGRDLAGAGSVLTLAGAVGRNIWTAGERATIGGQVGGNVRFRGERILLTPTASVTGNVTYATSERPVISSGARVLGGLHALPRPVGRGWRVPVALAIAWRVATAIGLLLVTLLVALLAPRALARSAQEIRRQPGQSLGWGVLALIGTPIVAIFLLITIVGIPVSLLLLLVWAIWLYLAAVPVGAFIGLQIVGADRERSPGSLAGAAVLGVLILILVDFIPIVGWVVRLLTLLFGMGAIGLTAAWLSHGRPVPPAVPPAAGPVPPTTTLPPSATP